MAKRNSKNARDYKIEALASEIAYRSGPEHTDGDLFAIGSQFSDDSQAIDEAVNIVNEKRQKAERTQR